MIQYIAYAICAILTFTLFYMRAQNDKMYFVNIETLGKERTEQQILNDLLRQKIDLRKVAFWFYIISLSLAFIGAIVLVYFIIQSNGMDTKKIAAAITFGSGSILTLGFRGLFHKCERDIKDFKNR